MNITDNGKVIITDDEVLVTEFVFKDATLPQARVLAVEWAIAELEKSLEIAKELANEVQA